MEHVDRDDDVAQAGKGGNVKFIWFVPLVVSWLVASGPSPALSQERLAFAGRSPVRVSGTLGAFRISHDLFENYYSSRWGLAPGGMVTVRLFGFDFLLGVRQFSKKLNDTQRQVYAGTGLTTQPAWEQWVFNFGISRKSGGLRRISSSTAFGLAYHRVQEKVAPLVTDKRNSSALGFFLLLEIEYLVQRRVSLSWLLELSSASATRTAAFEANSIGGIYLGGGVNFYLF